MTDASSIPQGPPRLGPAPKRMVPVAVSSPVPSATVQQKGKIPLGWILRRLGILVLGASAILLVSEATGFHLLRGAASLFFAGGWVVTVLHASRTFDIPIQGPAIDVERESFFDQLERQRQFDRLMEIGHERWRS